MAFAFVQTKHAVVSSGVSNDNVVTPDSPLTQGNLAVINIRLIDEAITVSSIVDSAGNTYALAAGPIDNDNASVRAYQYYGVQQVGGATSVTVTFSGSLPASRVTVDEFSGNANSNAAVFDTASSADDVASGTSASVPSFSPAAAGELIVAGLAVPNSISSVAAGTNYTLAQVQTVAVTQYRLSGGASETAPISWTTSVRWNEIAAAYKPAAPRVAVSGRVASTRTNSILYNGDFEVKPGTITAATSGLNKWVDGTAAGGGSKLAYGWAIVSKAGTAEVGFDTSIFRSGATSMKLSTLDTAGTMVIANYRTSPIVASSLFELFRLKADTSYTITGYIRTNNVVSNGAFIDLRQYRADGTATITTSTNKLSGTDTSFRQVTATVTTSSDTVFGSVLIRINLAGNVSDIWVDDVTVVPASIARVAASGRAAL